jgi:hypothetical protein
MATGTLIAESIRAGASLDDPSIVVRAIDRVAAANLSGSQREAGFPEQWTLLRFEVADADAERLAEALAGVLGDGWYADFHTADETFVVFAGRVCRYATGDAAGRTEAEAAARDRGVPDAQLDWP